MLAAQITPPVRPEAISVTEVLQPEPGPGDVLIRLIAAALNHRDLAVLQGARTPPGYSFVPGSDGAGEVAAVGEEVTDFAVGDAVLIYPSMRWGNRQDAPGPGFEVLGGVDNGTFAQYIVLPAENVRRKPDHLAW